jgi:hypothetical protein
VKRTATRSRLVVAGSIVAAALFLLAFARLWVYVIDDTYISLRYAQNLAHGYGLVYNPGERVEGYSNFLWTLFLAIPFALHIPPIPFLKVTLAIAVLVTAWLTARLARVSGLIGETQDPWVAWVPAWLLLITPLVIDRAADGLETIPFTLLLVLATTWAFEERGAGRFPRFGLALAGVALIRPYGVLFAPPLLAIAALRGARPAQVARAALVAAIPIAIHLVWRHAYYGDWLPNTFYAKRGGNWDLGWGSLLQFLAETGGWAWLAALPALVLKRTRTAAWMLMAVVAIRVAFHVWSGGAWIGRHRFLVTTLPFLYVLVVAGASALRAPVARGFALALAAVLLLVPAWLLHSTEEHDEIAYARGLSAAHGELGRDVEARSAADAVIAMDDAGLTPYLARRRSVDMLGLTDRHIGHLPGHFSAKYDVAYVLARDPDLIVLISTVAEPTSAAELPLAGDRAMAVDSVFLARYQFVRVYTMRPDYHLGVFRRRDSRAVPASF